MSLSLIRFNPTADQMAENTVRSERSRAADLAARSGEFQLAESQRRSQDEQAIDGAIREALRPPQTPASPPVMRGQGPGAIAEQPLPPPPGAVASPAGTPLGQRPEAPAPTAQPRAQSPGALAAERLANVRGGGRMALDLSNQARQEQDRQETQVYQYLSNPATAHLGLARAQQLGINIPPQLANNTAFWQGTSIAKQLYPDDPGAAQKFVSAFVTGGGAANVQAATQAGIAAAGAPVRRRQFGVVQGDDGPVFYDVQDPSHRISGPPRTQGQFVTQGDGSMAFLRQGRLQAEPVLGTDNQPLQAQRFGARGAPTSVFEQKRQAYLAANPGDEQGALAYAQGTKQLDPVHEQRIISGIVRQELGNPPDPSISTQQAQLAYQERFRARVQELTAQFRPQGARPQVPGPAPAADQHPTPQTEADFNALPSGAIYRDPDDGRLYRKP